MAKSGQVERDKVSRNVFVQDTVARAFGIMAVAANSAGDTITQFEAIELIEAQCGVVRELMGWKPTDKG